MKYYRLRDIRTPPFAYVVNRERAIRACRLCMMPFRDLDEALKVEVFTTELENWRHGILGKPLMAEHWLIGDQQFTQTLAELLPGTFATEAVELVSWLTRRPSALSPAQAVDLPEFRRVFPLQGLELDSGLVRDYPPIACSECKRSISDVPIDMQLLPETAGADSKPMFAFLSHLHLEGYDYLFHEDVVPVLRSHFPSLILEALEPEPLLF